MTTNPSKRKQLLIFAPIGTGDMIPTHHSMKVIQAYFREWGRPFPRLPHSREQSKRRRSSRILIRMSLARLRSLCTERVNPLLHQFSSAKTLVERWYSSVLLIYYRHSISILTVRLSPILLPKGLRICCVGFIKLIKPTVIPVRTGVHGVVKSSLNISVSCIRNCQTRLTRATWI